MSMPLEKGHFYQFGPFCLDPAERRLLRENQTVSLPPKSFDLLVLLVENQNRLVTKNQILESVWAGSFVEESNLTVSISAIRRALGERDDGLPFIETVPKAGYRFVAPVRILQIPPALSVAADSAGSPSPGKLAQDIVEPSNVLSFPVPDENQKATQIEGDELADAVGQPQRQSALATVPRRQRLLVERNCRCYRHRIAWPCCLSLRTPHPGRKRAHHIGAANPGYPSLSQSQG